MIDEDIEIGKIVINSEKSHVGAGRAPIRHEQPLNSGAAEGGNETVPGGKVGDNGSMQRERRAQKRGDAALDHGKVTQPDRLQLKRSLTRRYAFRFWRGTVAIAKIPGTAPRWTPRFQPRMRQQAPARTTPCREIDLRDADPFNIAMPALAVLT